MVPPRPPPPNYMAIGDEGSPMMHDERRTVDLVHKPNGEPNVYNATPRIIKKEPRVPKAEPAVSAAKAPAPSVEPVEFDPASSLKAQMRPYDASGDAVDSVRRCHRGARDDSRRVVGSYSATGRPRTPPDARSP